MFRKIFVVLSVLLLTAACSSSSGIKSTGNNAGDLTTNSIADRYGVASEDLDAFSPLRDGDIEGARASDRVFFGYDSSVLSNHAQRTLDKQIKWLKSHSEVSITVEGHCDERGTREYNLALGDRRANAVKKYLVGNGISSSRISVVSYGKERPAVLGSTPASWAENRRSVTVLNDL